MVLIAGLDGKLLTQISLQNPCLILEFFGQKSKNLKEIKRN